MGFSTLEKGLELREFVNVLKIEHKPMLEFYSLTISLKSMDVAVLNACLLKMTY